MTTQELAEYYSNLLIMQYHEMARAVATIEAIVTPVFIDQVPIEVQNAFNLETAVGVQLDTLGKYVGVTRYGNGLSGPISLVDSDYRVLIKMVLIANMSGSSLYTIQSLLAAAFPGQIYISDNQVMGLNYVIKETLGTSDLLELLVTGGYLPKPMAVQISVVIYPDIAFPYFGFVSYDSPSTVVSPFNSYSFYNLNSPWLSYAGVG